MIKLPSKALLYRDWRNSRWFIPLLALELLFTRDGALISQGERFRPILNLGMEMKAFFLFFFIISVTIALMSAVLFHYDRKWPDLALAAGMPFTREEILTSKWVVGVYNITVAYLFVFVLMNGMLIYNFCWTNFFTDIFKWFAVYLLMALCIFGFVLLAQSANGSALPGSILTVVCGAFPFTVIYVLYGAFYTHYNTGSIGEVQILVPGYLKGIVESGVFMVPVKAVAGLFLVDCSLGLDPSVTQSTGGFIARVLFFSALTFLFYILSLRTFRKSRYERVGRFTTVGAFEKIYGVVLSYTVGFLALMAYSLVVSEKTALRADSVIFFCVIIPILLYFVTGWILRQYDKRII